jgi:DNA sulfur modification protein DndD
MRIHYLKMQNYRQYVDARIEFSVNDGKVFTVLQGANGAGKSNVLNAITWCLYGQEKHLGDTDSKKLPIVNEKIFHALQPGQTESVRVEIGLGRRDIAEYVISRSAQVYKQIDGKFETAVEPNPKVLFMVRGNWKESDQPTLAIKSILPEKISRFFFFDGEHLDKFFQRDSAERVRQGIEDVSQIDLLDLARRHLDRVNSNLMKKSTGVGQADEARQNFEDAKKEVKACQEELKRLHNDRAGIEENIEAISEKQRTSSEEEVRQLQEERDGLNDEIEDYDKRIEDLITKANNKLRQAGPIVYTYAALEKTLTRIQDKVKHGELPPKVREPFFKDLLAHSECICGTPLPENSEARERVITRMQALSDEDYMDKATDGRYGIESLIRKLPENIRVQKELRGEIRQYEDAIRSHRRRLKEISEKIEQLGGEVNLEEIVVLEQQLNQFENKRTETDRLIGAEENKLKAAEKKRDDAQRAYQRALREEEKAKDILARSEICVQGLDLLNQVRTELLEETFSFP